MTHAIAHVRPHAKLITTEFCARAGHFCILIVTTKRGLGSAESVRSLAADMHCGQREANQIENHQHRCPPTQAISDV